jgi:hypothetical protein
LLFVRRRRRLSSKVKVGLRACVSGPLYYL